MKNGVMSVGLVAALALTAGWARGQTVDVVVSLSADDTLGSLAVRDEDLVFHPAGGEAYVSWPSETLALLASDIDGDGLAEVFGDVDAIHDAGKGATAADGLYLSLLSNEAGFLDGDVLHSTPSGMEIFRSEAAFVAVSGASDGNVDVDAIEIYPNGTLIFSFAEDESSSLLSGDTPGLIADGDVLAWDAGQAVASVLYTEAQITAFVTLALGTPTNAGDLMSLAADPLTGEILFTVQSPSAHDGSIFSTANAGSLLAGQAEADFGFAGSAEVDGLSVARSRFPGATVSSGRPAAGETLTIELRGATSGVPHIALGSLAMVGPVFPLAGWGGFILGSDPLLAATLAGAPQLALIPDGGGFASLPVQIPAGMLPTDVIMHVVGMNPGKTGCNPVLLELAQ